MLKLCCFYDVQRDIFSHIVPSFTLLRIQPSVCCDFRLFLGKFSTSFSLCIVSDLQHPGWMCLFDISKIYLVHQCLYFHLTSPHPHRPHHYHHLPFTVCSTYSQIRFPCCHYIKNRVSTKNTYTPLCCTFLPEAQHCIIFQMQSHFHLASNLAVLKRLLLWICFLGNLAVHLFCLNAENLCKILTSICHTPVDLHFSLKFSSTIKWRKKRKHFISC